MAHADVLKEGVTKLLMFENHEMDTRSKRPICPRP
jgi:hypothetical protein